MNKPRLLLVSKVNPFPRAAGQQQRVFYTMKALRESFHITFLTVQPKRLISSYLPKILDYCDEAIIIPSKYGNHPLIDLMYKIFGFFFVLFTGLKFSNFLIGKVEFSPRRIKKATKSGSWDLVLYEYWHSVDSVRVFQKESIPCVLDTHNILWKSQQRQLEPKYWIPKLLKQEIIQNYKKREENAWNKYNALIAINWGEFEYMQKVVNEEVKIFYTPMGTDLNLWPYLFQPVDPPRIAYYGGLGSEHNQKDALDCYYKIMPDIWEKLPNAEFWIVGSNPPKSITDLPGKDARVKVTGFVENVQEILKSISIVLCPWSGTYGFRSRLIEVMALGIPVVATSDAVFGMDLKEGEGLFIRNNPEEMASAVLDLLSDQDLLRLQSRLAMSQTEINFSYPATYQKLDHDLLSYINYPLVSN